MNHLADVQSKLASLREEYARLEVVLAESFGAADAEVARLKGELAAIDATHDSAAAEWGAAVAAGGPASSGPPLPPVSTTADVLRERLAEAERMAAVTRTARAPVKARVDELRALVWEQEAEHDRAMVSAMRYEAYRVHQELMATLAVARDLSERLSSARAVIASGVPEKLAVEDLLGVRPGAVENGKVLWRTLQAIFAHHPGAELSDATSYLAFRAQRDQAAQ
jgi:hypothetical protein